MINGQDLFTFGGMQNFVPNIILAGTIHIGLITLVAIGLVVTVLSIIFKRIKLPYIVAYIIAGLILGPSGLDVIHDKSSIQFIGELGLILLLFFIGMEIKLPDFLKNWKISIFGTLGQILLSLLLIFLIGQFFNWNLTMVVVFAFVTALSSSAVIIKILQERKELETKVGKSVFSILIAQDILIVPLIIITEFFGGKQPTPVELAKQVIGGILIIGTLIYVARKKELTLPVKGQIMRDHETQVFIALFLSFGFALITSFLGLSAALGAFVAGILVGSFRAVDWIHNAMESFHILFVSIFFISIGMLIDLRFFIENWLVITVLILVVYTTNHIINSVILYLFGLSKRESFYGGALLAQIGELSFVLALTAYQSNVIGEYIYQLTILVISLTLLISPFWVIISRNTCNWAGARIDRHREGKRIKSIF